MLFVFLLFAGAGEDQVGAVGVAVGVAVVVVA